MLVATNDKQSGSDPGITARHKGPVIGNASDSSPRNDLTGIQQIFYTKLPKAYCFLYMGLTCSPAQLISFELLVCVSERQRATK